MNIFDKLFSTSKNREVLKERDKRTNKHINVREGRTRKGNYTVSVDLNPDGVRETVARYREQIKEAKKDVETIVRENAKEIGWFSANINWMFIQEAGQYLSPIGSDRKHLVILTEVNRYAQNIELVSFECSNAIYSEWVKCCCDTMWHTKQKVLEDMHGNKYPIGNLCEVTCTIRYI